MNPPVSARDLIAVPANSEYVAPVSHVNAAHTVASTERPSVFAENLRALAMYKWPIATLGVLFGVIAAAIVSQMTPIYRATALLMIEGSRPRSVTNATEVMTGVTPEAVQLQTQAEVLRSRALASRVARELKLAEHPLFDPRQRAPGSIEDRWPALAPLVSPPAAAPLDESAVELAVRRRLQAGLRIETVRVSQLIRVHYESSDPVLAAAIANQFSEAYTRADQESRLRTTQNAGEWISARLDDLKAKLDASEQALQAYRDNQNLLDTKNTALSGAGKQLDEMIARLAEARSRRVESEAAYAQVRAAEALGRLETVPAVLRNAGVQQARQLEAEAERKFADLSKQFGAAHPRMIIAQNELATARENTAAQVRAVVGGITREYNAARTVERSVEEQLSRSKDQVRDVNRKEIELSALEREAATNRQLYQEFLTRYRETSVSLDPEQAKSRLVDRAVPPDSPVRPERLRIVLVATLLGILLGAGGALVLRRINNTIKSVEDVEARLGPPLLGALPILEGPALANAARVVLDYPDDLYAESIHTIATGMLLSSLDTKRKIIAITSTIAGEGKSTLAMNLALSQAGSTRVLLIEADLRRPTFARRWRMLSNHRTGLADLIAGTASIEECLLQINGSGLHVVMAGTSHKSPLDLLKSRKFAGTLARLASSYDLVVVDCPPVQLVSDALVIGALATGIVYVVKSDDTPVPLALGGLQRIEAANLPLIGVALNQHDFVKAERYYGEHTAYGRKYERYGGYRRA